MLLKWIVCTVPAPRRAAFSLAQEAWSRLADAPGFLGQVGGWSREVPPHACILGLWSDAAAYESFMAGLHDTVFGTSRQGETYESLSTLIVSPELAIGALPGPAPLRRTAGLRVADCLVHPGRSGHFVDVQQSVWIPAMAGTPGMLAGAFSRCPGREERYLVTTLWESEAAHDRYAREQVPALRETAAVREDVARLSSWCVRLEPAWTVLPGS